MTKPYLSISVSWIVLLSSLSTAIAQPLKSDIGSEIDSLLAAGNTKQAGNLARHLVQKDPKSYSNWIYLGRTYKVEAGLLLYVSPDETTEKMYKARECFAKAAGLDPNRSTAFVQMADSYAIETDFQNALKYANKCHFQKFLSLDFKSAVQRCNANGGLSYRFLCNNKWAFGLSRCVT